MDVVLFLLVDITEDIVLSVAEYLHCDGEVVIL